MKLHIRKRHLKILSKVMRKVRIENLPPSEYTKRQKANESLTCLMQLKIVWINSRTKVLINWPNFPREHSK